MPTFKLKQGIVMRPNAAYEEYSSNFTFQTIFHFFTKQQHTRNEREYKKWKRLKSDTL